MLFGIVGFLMVWCDSEMDCSDCTSPDAWCQEMPEIRDNSGCQYDESGVGDQSPSEMPDLICDLDSQTGGLFLGSMDRSYSFFAYLFTWTVG